VNIIEEWASDAARDAHFETPHLKAALAAVPQLVEGAPIINHYSLIA